jgi:hypothetical protein
LFALGSAASTAQQLAAGSLNVSELSTTVAVQAINAGAPIKYVIDDVSTAPYTLIARRGIGTVAPLKASSSLLAVRPISRACSSIRWRRPRASSRTITPWCTRARRTRGSQPSNRGASMPRAPGAMIFREIPCSTAEAKESVFASPISNEPPTTPATASGPRASRVTSTLRPAFLKNPIRPRNTLPRQTRSIRRRREAPAHPVHGPA